MYKARRTQVRSADSHVRALPASNQIRADCPRSCPRAPWIRPAFGSPQRGSSALFPILDSFARRLVANGLRHLLIERIGLSRFGEAFAFLGNVVLSFLAQLLNARLQLGAFLLFLGNFSLEPGGVQR